MQPITTPFGRHSTAAEVIAGIDLAGKRVIVTGGASGIGLEVARALASVGAHLTLTARDDLGAAAAADITATTGNPHVRTTQLELTDLSSIRAFVDAWGEEPLHILVNNAGIMALPQLEHTPQGWEEQFTTNHLGHFFLTYGLHSALTRAQGARVVSVSSSAHLFSPVVFDDIHYRFRPYDPQGAYAQAKTAVILFTVGLSHRWAAHGITANAANPGAIPTNLQRFVGGDLDTPTELQKTPQQGAATSVLLATSPLLDGISGRYFNDCAEARTVDQRPTDAIELVDTVANYATDPDNADRLWHMCQRLLD
ncbi:SDR family NAD(P)-dependent oxidoreductase [Plantactinospora sp. CA-290183]|uniref:SDR family NAD(P)-dependent oxidoreductase n=1 Tax=Plantactinospora sp. CA-290183 TaxID=3240006 RepID=UPI003D89BED9